MWFFRGAEKKRKDKQDVTVILAQPPSEAQSQKRTKEMKETHTLFAKILVPVDGSKFSLHAVNLAGRLALYHNSSLLLMHVLDVAIVKQLQRLGNKSHDEVVVEMEKNARGFLKSMGLEIKGQHTPVAMTIKEGVPHEAILEEAERWQADLIVMGKLGKRGIGRILLGSVAERVIEFSKLPVMLATGNQP